MGRQLEEELSGPRVAYVIPRAPLDIHLSHEFLSADPLINLLCQHNPATFPWKGNDSHCDSKVLVAVDEEPIHESRGLGLLDNLVGV